MVLTKVNHFVLPQVVDYHFEPHIFQDGNIPPVVNNYGSNVLIIPHDPTTLLTTGGLLKMVNPYFTWLRMVNLNHDY